MLAELYNAGVKVKTLTETFCFARTTIKRWADALASGDPQRLIQALSGPGPKRKLTTEVISFVRMRFNQIYSVNKYDYSKQIRAEIKEVFELSISAETLRPLFGKLKQGFNSKNHTEQTPDDDQKRSNGWDCSDARESQYPDSPADNDNQEMDNRKNSLAFYQQGPSQQPLFCHHAGILLFADILIRLQQFFAYSSDVFVQWIVTILIGAVNIEQTKLLDFESLKRLLGTTVIASLYHQRTCLDEMANAENLTNLFRFNAELIGAGDNREFYYDPHAKHYTGAGKILKGWCPKVKGIGKVMHMDFIHSKSGAPVFVEHTDNFHDLRERFPKTVANFREMMGLQKDTTLSFTIDRGIFRIDLFSQLRDKLNIHIITWEKGYKESQWDDRQQKGDFIIKKPRNCSTDLKNYRFRFMDRPWHKDPSIRQIIVLAANPRGKTIEVSILATNPDQSAESIITSIFTRWLQENDFKYMNSHFGINEITSYAVVNYRKLKNLTEDKQVKSGKLKALQFEKRKLKVQLGLLLTQKHLGSSQSSKSKQKIEILSEQIKAVDIQICNNKEKVSRLDELIADGYIRLDTSRKSLMDAIKITSRNIFYKRLEPFVQIYDNYRDDHVVFRNLTRCHGFIHFGNDIVEVMLYPTMCYQPKIRGHIERLLAGINENKPIMPDGSKRIIRFSLREKASKLFAIQTNEN